MIHSTLDNRKIVLFGYGSIKITSAYIDEQGMLALQTNPETMPIGSSLDVDKSYEEQIEEVRDAELILEFNNVASLECLILKLQEVRAMMLGYDTDRIDEWKRHNNLTAVYQPNALIDGTVSNVDGVLKPNFINKGFNKDEIGVIFDGDQVRKRTNREVHELAAGMSLDNGYFASQGIDPDEEYHKTRSHNAAKAVERMDIKCNK